MRSAGAAAGVPIVAAGPSPYATIALTHHNGRSTLHRGHFSPPPTGHHGVPRVNHSSLQHHSTAPRAISAPALAPAPSVPPGYGPATATPPLTHSPFSFLAHQGSGLADYHPLTSSPTTISPFYFTNGGTAPRQGYATEAGSSPSARSPFASMACGKGSGAPPEEASAGVEGALVGLKRTCSDPVSAVRSHLPPWHTDSDDVPCNGCSGGRCFSQIRSLALGP